MPIGIIIFEKPPQVVRVDEVGLDGDPEEGAVAVAFGGGGGWQMDWAKKCSTSKLSKAESRASPAHYIIVIDNLTSLGHSLFFFAHIVLTVLSILFKVLISFEKVLQSSFLTVATVVAVSCNSRNYLKFHAEKVAKMTTPT